MNVQNFTPIISSNLAGVAHDGQDLYIKFNKGYVYQYHNVPSRIMDELLAAPSAGQYFHGNIASVFEYTKV